MSVFETLTIKRNIELLKSEIENTTDKNELTELRQELRYWVNKVK